MQQYLQPIFFSLVLLIIYRSWIQSFVNYDLFGDTLHRLHPWFNYRATKYLSDHGWTAFFHWFDRMSWYPIGRPVGTTIYPGLQITAVGIHRVLQWVGYPLPLLHVCFRVPSIVSVFTKLFTYLLALEMLESQLSATASLAILSLTPVHILNSFGGEFSFECVAALGMVATFYFWVRSLRTPSSWPIGIMTGLAYGYMVSTWGGFVFVLNMVALHAGVMGVMDWARNAYNPSLLKAYGLFFGIGTGIAVRVPPVGWTPFLSVEQLGAVFVLMMLLGLFLANKNRRKATTPREEERVSLQGVLIVLISLVSYFIVFVLGLRGNYFQFLRPSICGMIPGLLRLPSIFFHRAYLLSRRSISDQYILTMYGVNFFAIYFTTVFLVFWLYVHPFYPRILLFLVLPTCCICITRYADGDAFAPLLAIGAGSLIEVSKRMILYEFSAQFSQDGVVGDGNTVDSKPEEVLNQSKATKESYKVSTRSHHKEKDGQCYENNTSKHILFPYFQIDITEKIDRMREKNGALLFTCAGAPIFLLVAVMSLTGFFTQGGDLVPIFSNPGVSYLNYSHKGIQPVTDYIDSYHWIKENTPYDARFFSTMRPSIHISSIGNRISFGDESMRDASYHAVIGKILLSTPEEAHEWLRHLADYAIIMSSDSSVGDRNLLHYYALVAHDYYPDICPADPDCSEYNLVNRNDTGLFVKDKASKTLLYHLSENNNKTRNGALHGRFEEVYSSANNLVQIYKIHNVNETSKAWSSDERNLKCTNDNKLCSGQFPPSTELDILLSQ